VNNKDDAQRYSFPILRGESVSEAGEFSGKVVIICKPEELEREWALDSIPVLHNDLEIYFNGNPASMDRLFEEVTAVLAEFGESISQFATYATQHGAIAVVKVSDATHVLENDMHIRVEADENQGDVFFID
jgi:phosphohistidine swiveling domain-containing protein